MLLDTCFCIDLFREISRGEKGPAFKRMEELKNSSIFISMFTLCELKAGAELSRKPEEELRRIEFISNYAGIIYPDTSFPVIYGEAEAFLRKNGVPIPVMVLLIAVAAKSAGLPVLTKDIDHFKRVPGLVVEAY